MKKNKHIAGITKKNLAFIIVCLLLNSCGSDSKSCDSSEESDVAQSSTYAIQNQLVQVEPISATWKNKTTGTSGDGVVTSKTDCVLLTCTTVHTFDFFVPVEPGENEIETRQVYEDGGDRDCITTTYFVTR